MNSNKSYSFFILSLVILFFLTPYTLKAQKKSKSAKTNKAIVVSDETRKLSIIYADGLREYFANDYNSAEKSFRNVIAQNPKNDAAYFMLGKIKFDNSDFAGAQFYFLEALKIDNNNEWYKVELGNTYNQLADYKNAAKIWEELCKLKPSNEYYLFLLAEAYLNLDLYPKVISTYDKIEVLMGYNDELTQAKVSIWLYLNDIKGAVAEYEKLIKAFPNQEHYYIKIGDIYQTNNMPDKAIDYYEKALLINPKEPFLNYSLSNYYYKIGEEEKSFEMVKNIFRSSQFPLDDKLPLLDKYYLKAMKSKEKNDFLKCDSLATILLSVNPDNSIGWATKGSIYLLQKEHAIAKKYYAKAIEIDNTQYSLWEDYLHILLILNDYQAIISHYATVTEMFPTNAIMLYDFGVAYLKSHQIDQAIPCLQKALSFAYDKPLLASIYFKLGDCYNELGKKEEAKKYWELAKKNGMDIQELDK